MKRILATTAIVLATATAVSAQDREQLMGSVQGGLESMGMTVNYDALSNDQLAQLSAMLSGSGNEESNQAQVQDFLQKANALEGDSASGSVSSDSGATSDEDMVSIDMPRSQLESTVDHALSGMPQVDAQASELTTKELSQIFLVLSGGMEQQDQAQQINAILGNN